MRQTVHSAQKGFALLLVMVIGTVALYAATGLIGNGTATEREAQERDLLKLRAYWAGMGHINYGMSRARQGPPCGGKCKNMVNWEDFFVESTQELNEYEKGAFKGAGNGRDRHWIYPEISPDYFMPLHLHSEFITGESKIELRVHYQDPGPGGKNAVVLNHPFINRNWHIREGFAAIICVGLADFTTPCATNNKDMDQESSLMRVVRMEPRE